MRSRLDTPHGHARITLESPQLVAITADTEDAAYFAQGYAAGALRMWQLELTRRVAAGELSALFGAETVKTDRFHRDLGLSALARREALRDAGSRHAAQIEAYVAGLNLARVELPRPVELVLLGTTPRPFTALDVHLVGQLKYFINSAWQFELLHTLIAGALGPHRAAQLFATFTEEGTTIAPLPHELSGALAGDVADVLAAGVDGLARLGLSSPDLGSNAIAIAGSRTVSGFPLLAADPHMGNVNPGFNLLCKLETRDGLAIVGSHFPGAPGIVIGRNRDCAWGMVGIMADNQDLFVGRLDGNRVRIDGDWVALDAEPSAIDVRGQASIPHVARGFARGRLLHARGDHALFLRWPALDAPIGAISLSELARAHDFGSFRRGLSRMTNAPMLAVYADRFGHVGYQVVGLVPARPRVGSLVQSLDAPSWTAYHAFDELPHALDPGDVVAYANQYALAMFDGRPHLSNRWHPPTRAWRIAELVAEKSRHDVRSLCALQDDRVDRFARDQQAFVSALVPLAWDGNTNDVAPALRFERWMIALVEEVLRGALPRELADRYADLWPGHRWNVLAILRHPTDEWGIDPREVATRAWRRATAIRDRPRVELRHTLRRHPIGRALFSPSYPYDGGARETIHVARRNTDFLTSSQAGGGEPGAYHFGPAFKLVCDLSPATTTHYLANTPASGSPFAFRVARALRRWRAGRRYVTRLR